MLLSTLSLQDRKTQPSSSGEAMSREDALQETQRGEHRILPCSYKSPDDM